MDDWVTGSAWLYSPRLISQTVAVLMLLQTVRHNHAENTNGKAGKQTLKYPARLGTNGHQLSQFLNMRTLCLLHMFLQLVTTYI